MLVVRGKTYVGFRHLIERVAFLGWAGYRSSTLSLFLSHPWVNGAGVARGGNAVHLCWLKVAPAFYFEEAEMVNYVWVPRRWSSCRFPKGVNGVGVAQNMHVRFHAPPRRQVDRLLADFLVPQFDLEAFNSWCAVISSCMIEEI
jgi:hypothetical protein